VDDVANPPSLDDPRAPVRLCITVRYFAAAQAAAGTEEETLTVRPGTTVADLVARLATDNDDLADVLRRCSYLCDGLAVRDTNAALCNGQILDVLPPFAGG
jgi:molybdopterin converting factor small subunit